MTGQDFAKYVRFLTNTNSSTFDDENIVLLANTIQRNLARKIANLDEGEFELPMVRDLVASSEFDDREYDFDYDVIRIKRLEAYLDEQWVRFDKFKHNALKRPTTEAEVRDYFANSQGNAFYDVFRRSLWLFCGEIKAQEVGLKMWAQVYPSRLEVSDLSLQIDLSIPQSANTFRMPAHFHEIWARTISRIYRTSKDQPLPESQMEMAINQELDTLLGDYANSSLEDSPMQAHLPDDRHLMGW